VERAILQRIKDYELDPANALQVCRRRLVICRGRLPTAADGWSSAVDG
jgi:hypothetical protein